MTKTSYVFLISPMCYMPHPSHSPSFYHPNNYLAKRTNYEGVTKSFRTGRLERELQMVQLFATGCSCIAMSSAAITICVAPQRVFIIVNAYFITPLSPETFGYTLV
jgi:hypothetical protein